MLVKVRELKPGMILLRDLEHDGHVILKSRSFLSAAIISILKIRGIACVDVEETEDHIAPGADIYYQRTLHSDSDADYQQKKHATEELFANTESDPQTSLLKYCILSQMEEKHDEPA